jgi:hypothetical protein
MVQQAGRCCSARPAGALTNCCVALRCGLSGAATGQLLNTLHTPAMSYHGHKQMNRFTQWSVISFLFSGYQVNIHPALTRVAGCSRADVPHVVDLPGLQWKGYCTT